MNATQLSGLLLKACNLLDPQRQSLQWPDPIAWDGRPLEEQARDVCAALDVQLPHDEAAQLLSEQLWNAAKPAGCRVVEWVPEELRAECDAAGIEGIADPGLDAQDYRVCRATVPADWLLASDVGGTEGPLQWARFRADLNADEYEYAPGLEIDGGPQT